MENTTTKTLGQLIGIQKHSCKTTLPSGESATNTIKIDFTTSSDNEVISWLCANRAIAGQRPWKGLSIDELKALDGQTFSANRIGQKVKSKADKIEALYDTFVSIGMDEDKALDLATKTVNNPKAMKIVEEATPDEPFEDDLTEE